MFYRQIDHDLKVALSVPQFAQELFQLTDRNRQFLEEWLPWLDTIQCADDTKAFIELQLQRFSKGEVLHQSLFLKGRLCGVTAFNRVDHVSGIGYIGYWLGQEFTGQGIMTAALQDLIRLGFSNWPLHRMEIRSAVENVKSRSVAERLGFRHEGTIRSAERVYGKFYDHAVYGMLREESVG